MIKGLDDRMIDNFFWQLKVHRVFNEVEDRLAATGVAANINVRLEIWNLPRITRSSLHIDGLEEKLEALFEASLHAQTCAWDATGPVA